MAPQTRAQRAILNKQNQQENSSAPIKRVRGPANEVVPQTRARKAKLDYQNRQGESRTPIKKKKGPANAKSRGNTATKRASPSWEQELPPIDVDRMKAILVNMVYKWATNVFLPRLTYHFEGMGRLPPPTSPAGSRSPPPPRQGPELEIPLVVSQFPSPSRRSLELEKRLVAEFMEQARDILVNQFFPSICRPLLSDIGDCFHETIPDMRKARDV